MRIDVVGQDEFASGQARAYAEYRMFTTLARHAGGIRTIAVVLEHGNPEAADDCATCVVNVALEPSGDAVVRAHGRHVHRAIDRAAELVSALVSRKLPLSMTVQVHEAEDDPTL